MRELGARGSPGQAVAGARQPGPGRWARGLGARRAAWARGLALGFALGALDLFLARFDSVFFLSHQMNTVHCKINFEKKKNIYIYIYIYFKFN